MRFIRLILTAVAIASGAPAFAQADRAAVEALVAQIAADPVQAREQAIVWFGDVGAHEATFVSFIAAAFAEPAFADYIFDNAGAPTGTTAEWLAGPVQMVGREAARRGVARLSSEQQLAYLQSAVVYSQWVGANRPEGCRLLLIGDPADPALNAIEVAYRAAQPVEAIAATTAIGLEGLVAEVTGAPPVNAFAGEDFERGYQTYIDAIGAAPNVDTFVAIMNGDLTAAPADLCAAQLLSLTAIVGLPEPERSWVMQLSLGQG